MEENEVIVILDVGSEEKPSLVGSEAIVATGAFSFFR